MLMNCAGTVPHGMIGLRHFIDRACIPMFAFFVWLPIACGVAAGKYKKPVPCTSHFKFVSAFYTVLPGEIHSREDLWFATVSALKGNSNSYSYSSGTP